ncbi:hypothetical protein SEVIR_5G372750v4 [Setaria viridis]
MLLAASAHGTLPLGVARRYTCNAVRARDGSRPSGAATPGSPSPSPPAISQRPVASRGAAGCGWSLAFWLGHTSRDELARRGRKTHVVGLGRSAISRDPSPPLVCDPVPVAHHATCYELWTGARGLAAFAAAPGCITGSKLSRAGAVVHQCCFCCFLTEPLPLFPSWRLLIRAR